MDNHDSPQFEKVVYGGYGGVDNRSAVAAIKALSDHATRRIVEHGGESPSRGVLMPKEHRESMSMVKGHTIGMVQHIKRGSLHPAEALVLHDRFVNGILARHGLR